MAGRDKGVGTVETPLVLGAPQRPPPSLVEERLQFERKSLSKAYVYCILFGLFGMHHFYLKRYFFGVMYAFTFGLCGFGWLLDLLRLPCLVREANIEDEEQAREGRCVARQRVAIFSELRRRTLIDAYVLWFSPVGLLGMHHYYLGRVGYGRIYCYTYGLLGVGWLVDLFRMPSLVRKANDDLDVVRRGEVLEITAECTIADAYQLAFPFGFLGLHYFYMGRIQKGLVFLLTGGLLGIGWLVDLFRMPCLVRRHNEEVQNSTTWLCHLNDAYMYALPLGILGFHRFYTRNPMYGCLYLFTGGLFLIGWLVDLCRMRKLVAMANAREVRYRELFPGSDVQYRRYVSIRPINRDNMAPSTYGSMQASPPPYNQPHGQQTTIPTAPPYSTPSTDPPPPYEGPPSSSVQK